MDGKPHPTKMKRVRKALPPGISEHDAKVLTKVKRRAYRLDMSLFSCCGVRFGWSSVIGFVPAIGDILDCFMAMMVLRTCQQVEGGLPVDVKSKMMFNIVIDFVIGLVPFIGDLADAVFRANTKNAAELEKYLRKKGANNLRLSGIQQPLVDPSDPEEFDRMMNNGSPPEYTNEAPRPQQPMRPAEANTISEAQAQQEQQRAAQGNMNYGSSGRMCPPTTKNTTTTTPQRNGGFLGGLFGGKKNRQVDVESGVMRREDQALPSLPQQQQQQRMPQQPARVQKTRR